MTKADVVSEIHALLSQKRSDVDKKLVQDVVEQFFDVLKDNMTKGQNVYFRGFGSFIIKTRAEKVARNIAKNTAMKIPPHSVPAFKPAKTFVDDVKVKVKVAKTKAKAKK